MQILDPPRGRRLPATFRSLHHRNFRLLWFGELVSSSGDWMDKLAFNWLIYQMTGSAFYLAIINFLHSGPALVLILVGGAVADRMQRRRLMIITQTAGMLMALLLAILVSTNLVQVWMVLVIALARGVTMSFNGPARHSLLPELVPREDLMNAIALNSATINLTKTIGPAIAGILIATVGVAGAFYFNAASYVAVLYGLALMRFVERPRKAVRTSVFADVVGGARYLHSQPILWMLVLLFLLPSVFGGPYVMMLAVFAKDVLDVGPIGMGFLTAAASCGAVIGALFVAGRSRGGGRRGWVVLLCLMAYGVALGLFAYSHWFWLSLVALVAVGSCQQAYEATNNSLVQEHVHDEYRGRVLSTMLLNRGLVPLGAIVVGLGTEVIGVQITMGAMAAIVVLIALVSARFAPVVRWLQ